MTFEEITAFLAARDVNLIDSDYSLSETFQGTIGRMFWFDVSNIDPEGHGDDMQLVVVYRDINDHHLQVETHQGTIKDVSGPFDREFECVQAHVTFADWMELMTRQMKDSFDQGV